MRAYNSAHIHYNIMPRKVTNKPQRKAKRIMEKIEKVDATLEPVENLPALKDIPMINIAVKQILKGTTTRKLQAMFKASGFEVGLNTTYRIIEIAKAEIVRHSEKNFDVNFAWCQQNLMKLHSNAVDENDDKMRLVVIKEIINLCGLNRPREVEEEKKDITPEMIEEFEQKLLR